ncbi:pimeloyl-ACP methyl ester carboxylesterase [Micromonospora profundi]|nr:alpha/beta fold hydrolase [Micromonospora profundi]NJC11595.1 pimeloyl-ACP methyl ester carboxylesterase [Micromonospora profundi]
MTDPQPTIVLVHGAFAESASWNGVIDHLGAAYDVVALANPLRSVPSDAAYLRDVMGWIGGPVILVGHSYGGMVITQAAADDPSVRALVYVNALAPDTGDSALSLSGKFPGSTLADTLVQYPVSTGGNEVAIGQDRYHAQFAADVSDDMAALMGPDPAADHRAGTGRRALRRPRLAIAAQLVRVRRRRHEHPGRRAPVHGRTRGSSGSA